MASASPLISQKSTFKACSTTSETPDCFEMTTGTFKRIASSGTIPKGSDIEGVSEVVEHALKVDFWDINGLADAIYGICKYKAVNDIFRKEGKEEVDNLKWEYAAKKIKNVYELAINKK